VTLCAEDLKAWLERPELSFKGGLTVCTSATSFLDDVERVLHQVSDSTSLQQAKMVFLLLALSEEMEKTLTIGCLNEAVKRVGSVFSADCDFYSHGITEKHLAGSLCILLVGMPKSASIEE